MPRFFIRSKRKPRAQATFKVYRPWWVDPFLAIQGSSIEKMVMAELVRRGIYFEHTVQSNTLGGFVDPTWEPDFLLPQFKIWIEIQGSYFHSLPGQIEGDAFRYAAIQTAGWRPIFWWEWDIRTRLQDLFNAVPEFYQVNLAVNQAAAQRYGRTAGLPFFEGGFDKSGRPIDHLAGLRKALSNRAKPTQLTKRYSRRRRPK